MILFSNVTKRYSNGRGLRDVDLSFGPGIHGIIGKNGAGKTTALKLIVGLLTADSGLVTIDGHAVGAGSDGFEYRRSLGFFPDEDYFFPFLSGRRNLRYLGYLRSGDKDAYEASREVAEALDVDRFLDEPFASYSAGMRRKVQLLGSLVGDPDILIWDEPNNGVDVMANIYIRDLLHARRAAGKTILLSSHVLEFMTGLLDSITVFDEGRVAAREEPVDGDLQALFLSAIDNRGG